MYGFLLLSLYYFLAFFFCSLRIIRFFIIPGRAFASFTTHTTVAAVVTDDVSAAYTYIRSPPAVDPEDLHYYSRKNYSEINLHAP